MRIVIVLMIVVVLLGQLGEARRRTRMGGRRGMDTGITKGLASMYKSMTDDDEEEEDLLVSGKDIKADVKNYRLHTNMLSDSMSIIIIVTLSVLSVGVILYCLFFKAKNMETDFDYARIRELRAERDRSLKLVKAIAEHGVHPDRANGNIYRIRL
jgi:hypothetical protein